MLMTDEFYKDLISKFMGRPVFMVGSCSGAFMEHYFGEEPVIEFHDIDILCLYQSKKDYMDIYHFFHGKYGIEAKFSWYSPQLLGVEELIQEASMFTINRFLIDFKKRALIYDGDTFETPKFVPMLYKYAQNSKKVEFNPDCCTYFYTDRDSNAKQLEMYGQLTWEHVCQLRKEVMYTTDPDYIRDFYNSEKRYSRKPKSISPEKPKGYYIKYFDVKKKFNKHVYKLDMKGQVNHD